MKRPKEDETSFAQEYDPKTKTAETLHIYCRLCLRVFPVHFKPRPDARLRCVCGHEEPVARFDVFKTDKRARDFEALYAKIFKAAKDALRAANLPIPPSGKLPIIKDGMSDMSDIQAVRLDDPEDSSDIASSYVGEGSDARGMEADEKESELREAIEAAEGVIERHEALTELVEHLYCIRHIDEGARERFEKACREDIDLAPEVVREAKRRKRSGSPARVAFSCFKHLALVLEEEKDLKGALAVVGAARKIGLPGYDDRAAELERAVSQRAKAKKSRSGSHGSRA